MSNSMKALVIGLAVWALAASGYALQLLSAYNHLDQACVDMHAEHCQGRIAKAEAHRKVVIEQMKLDREQHKKELTGWKSVHAANVQQIADQSRELYQCQEKLGIAP